MTINSTKRKNVLNGDVKNNNAKPVVNDLQQNKGY